MQTVHTTSPLTLCAEVMGSVCLCHCDCVISDLYVISFIVVFKTSLEFLNVVPPLWRILSILLYLIYLLTLNPHTHSNKLYRALGWLHSCPDHSHWTSLLSWAMDLNQEPARLLSMLQPQEGALWQLCRPSGRCIARPGKFRGVRNPIRKKKWLRNRQKCRGGKQFKEKSNQEN